MRRRKGAKDVAVATYTIEIKGGSPYILRERTPETPEELAQRRAEAARSNPDALFELGLLYYYAYRAKELGVKPNKRRGLRWIRQAAKLGSPRAQFSLGTMYKFGSGEPKNRRKAIKWFRLAAHQGSAWAQDWLAGALGNNSTALRWLEAAAAQGHQPAIDELLLKRVRSSPPEDRMRLPEEAYAKGNQIAGRLLGKSSVERA